MAPEVIQLQGASTASDIYSLGCTIVELITGKPPYSELLPMSAMFRIVEDDQPPIPPKCSPELVDFLELCFAKNPKNRPSADELFGHVWLQKNWDPQKVCIRLSFFSLASTDPSSVVLHRIFDLKIRFPSLEGSVLKFDDPSLTFMLLLFQSDLDLLPVLQSIHLSILVVHLIILVTLIQLVRVRIFMDIELVLIHLDWELL